METITITLSKKMPIGRRVLETGNHLREWVQDLHVRFNAERDKLQLEKWELRDAQYHYHYLILRGKELSAGKMNIKHAELNSESSGLLRIATTAGEPPKDIPTGTDTMVREDIAAGDEI
jgi:hypothetical protein